jgi:hypothetical protein
MEMRWRKELLRIENDVVARDFYAGDTRGMNKIGDGDVDAPKESFQWNT